MRGRFLLFLGLMASIVGCKSLNSSKGKSLDALAGEKSENICHAQASANFDERYDTFWAQKSILGEGYQDRLKGIFAAVPLELQSWYFLKGGVVKLVGNAKAGCDKLADATALFRNSGEIGGCIDSPRDKSLATMPTMYIEVSATTYQEQMEQASLIVQGFGVVLSTFVTEIALAENLSDQNDLMYELGTYDTEMRNLKAGLAFVVIDDLLKGKNADGKPYAESMPDQFKSKIASSKALDGTLDRDTRWAAFWNAYNEQGHREFINYVVSQVFETHWCNDKTRSMMYGDTAVFKDTGKFFKKDVEPVFAAAFDGQPQDAGSASLAEDSSSNVSFATEVMSGAPSADVAGLDAGLELGGGRVFPVLGAVLRAPFAVARYFSQNKPVRTWFSTHQPVRKVLWGAAQAVRTVARGAAVVTGRVVGSVGRAVFGYPGMQPYQAGVNQRNAVFPRVGYRIQNGCLIRRWRC
jgi:hypothetical protein